jgi:predicted nucleotidyltransferase
VEKKLSASLQTAVTFLEKHGIRYAVIGGIALSQWGVIRVTRDIDFKVLAPDTNYDNISSLLYKNFPEKARLDIPENPLIISVVIDGIIADFLLAIPGYEELIIERAIRRDMGGWSLWICSAEDLIIQKAIAGRERDWPDIEALLIEQHAKLDDEYIENWLSQFTDALEDPEILANYKRLKKKIQTLI